MGLSYHYSFFAVAAAAMPFSLLCPLDETMQLENSCCQTFGRTASPLLPFPLVPASGGPL